LTTSFLCSKTICFVRRQGVYLDDVTIETLRCCIEDV